ncbi:MAG: hypothetical protein ACKPKO_43950, partial [Candidatus Fonsibacter sp.]
LGMMNCILKPSRFYLCGRSFRRNLLFPSVFSGLWVLGVLVTSAVGYLGVVFRGIIGVLGLIAGALVGLWSGAVVIGWRHETPKSPEQHPKVVGMRHFVSINILWFSRGHWSSALNSSELGLHR